MPTARAAEDALLAWTFRAVDEGTKPPTPQQLEHAKELRNTATELLKKAIAELRHLRSAQNIGAQLNTPCT